MTTTALDICSAALKKLGVLGAGETLSYDDAADAFVSLNSLMDQFAAERGQIYTVTRTTWTITTSVQNYSVGTGSTVNVARPMFVDDIHFQDTSVSPTLEYPMTMLTEDAWANLRQRTITSPYPQYWYFNPTYPTATISLWPVPTSTTLQGVLYAPTAIAQFTALGQTVALPPGYAHMLITNLALELAPDYDRQPSPALVEAARNSMAVVKRSNHRIADLSMPPGALIQGSGGWYDINSDG